MEQSLMQRCSRSFSQYTRWPVRWSSYHQTRTPQKRYSSLSPLITPPLDINPSQRVDKIFKNMDRDKDAKLTYDEFVEGSKQDPTIVQVNPFPPTSLTFAEPLGSSGAIPLRRPRIVAIFPFQPFLGIIRTLIELHSKCHSSSSFSEQLRACLTSAGHTSCLPGFYIHIRFIEVVVAIWLILYSALVRWTDQLPYLYDQIPFET